MICGVLPPMANNPANPIILYDGVCGLCNRFNQFVLKRDPGDRFRFASLQSDFAAKVLHRHGINPRDLDTVYLVLDYAQPGERLLARSDAALSVLQEIAGLWRVVAAVLGPVAQWVFGWGFKLIFPPPYPLFWKIETSPPPRRKTPPEVLRVW